MDYRLALSHLNSLQATDIKLGLSRITAVCEGLGHPERKFPSIIVAGTNGKGSTCAFLESILRHSGLKVGLYTSPHLVDVRERIQIDRKVISEDDFARSVEKIKSLNDKLPSDLRPTYFEFLTAMAFQYFADESVNAAVLEVGLGGRFDATNIVEPLVSVITRIDIDHHKYLGNTLDKIASEKCGVIKNGIPIVTPDQSPEAMDVIRKTSDKMGAPLHLVNRCEVKWKLGLLGTHQAENAACAVRAAEIVLKDGCRWPDVRWDENFVADALLDTKWAGRIEIVSKRPLIILDGAHNPNGAASLTRYLKEAYPDRRKVLMVGIMADKDIEGIVQPLASVADEWVITRPALERAANREAISVAIKRWSLSTKGLRFIEPVSAAIREIAKELTSRDILVVTGSLYTVGEAKMYFSSRKRLR